LFLEKPDGKILQCLKHVVKTTKEADMSTSAIIFMIFGLLLTWGGAAVCIFIAMKKRDI